MSLDLNGTVGKLMDLERARMRERDEALAVMENIAALKEAHEQHPLGYSQVTGLLGRAADLERERDEAGATIETLRGILRRYDVECPRARTDMTPCAARHGQTACADDGLCVGCGQHPADLLTALVPKYVAAAAEAKRVRGLQEALGRIADCHWYPKCASECGADIAECCDKRIAEQALAHLPAAAPTPESEG